MRIAYALILHVETTLNVFNSVLVFFMGIEKRYYIINYLKHYITIAYFLQQNIIIKQCLFEYKYNYKTIEKSETNGILSGGLPQEPCKNL